MRLARQPRKIDPLPAYEREGGAHQEGSSSQSPSSMREYGPRERGVWTTAIEVHKMGFTLEAGDPGRPTGTVTFLFTDIEGSTRRWERDRNAMSAALARHDALMRARIAARGRVYVFKTVGRCILRGLRDSGETRRCRARRAARAAR